MREAFYLILLSVMLAACSRNHSDQPNFIPMGNQQPGQAGSNSQPQVHSASPKPSDDGSAYDTQELSIGQSVSVALISSPSDENSEKGPVPMSVSCVASVRDAARSQAGGILLFSGARVLLERNPYNLVQANAFSGHDSASGSDKSQLLVTCAGPRPDFSGAPSAEIPVRDLSPEHEATELGMSVACMNEPNEGGASEYDGVALLPESSVMIARGQAGAVSLALVYCE